MKILALDTSTEACSAALALDGEITERFALAPREHTTLILPMLDELLAAAGMTVTQLDGIAFGCGPGSFTGVRIAASITQGIAFGAELPVVPISSLAALAQGVYRDRGMPRVLVALDARMGEVYWGVYQNSQGCMRAADNDGLYAPEQVPIPEESSWFGAGSGWGSYSTLLRQRLADKLIGEEAEHYPRAYDVAQLALEEFKLGHVVCAEQALPLYLRNEVTWKKHRPTPLANSTLI